MLIRVNTLLANACSSFTVTTLDQNRMFSTLEKQSSVGAFQKSYSEKFCKIFLKNKKYKAESLFNEEWRQLLNQL